MDARKLQVWEELVGKVMGFTQRGDETIVNVSGREYALPSFPKELLRKLSVKGAIGVLRMEDGYVVRRLKRTGDKGEARTSLQKAIMMDKK